MRIHVHPQRNVFCLDAFDDLHQSRIWQCDGAGCLLCSLPARERWVSDRWSVVFYPPYCDDCHLAFCENSQEKSAVSWPDDFGAVFEMWIPAEEWQPMQLSVPKTGVPSATGVPGGGFGTALSRSWVLLVNSARRSQPTCLYFKALGHSSPSQIRPEIAYSWPM